MRVAFPYTFSQLHLRKEAGACQQEERRRPLVRPRVSAQRESVKLHQSGRQPLSARRLRSGRQPRSGSRQQSARPRSARRLQSGSRQSARPRSARRLQSGSRQGARPRSARPRGSRPQGGRPPARSLNSDSVEKTGPSRARFFISSLPWMNLAERLSPSVLGPIRHPAADPLAR